MCLSFAISTICALSAPSVKSFTLSEASVVGMGSAPCVRRGNGAMRASARRQASILDMPEILLIKTSSLGDVIHEMPALTEARTQRPDARFSWVVEEAYAPLVRLQPAVAELRTIATRRWRKTLYSPATWGEMRAFKQTLRDRTYDEVIDT